MASLPSQAERSPRSMKNTGDELLYIFMTLFAQSPVTGLNNLSCDMWLASLTMNACIRIGKYAHLVLYHAKRGPCIYLEELIYTAGSGEI